MPKKRNRKCKAKCAPSALRCRFFATYFGKNVKKILQNWAEKGTFAEKERSMSEKVVISKRKKDGSVQVFSNMTEAADAVGVSRQAISKALLEDRCCADRIWKRAFRIYVIKAEGEYQVCKRMGTIYSQVAGKKWWDVKTVNPAKVVDITAQIWGAAM